MHIRMITNPRNSNRIQAFRFCLSDPYTDVLHWKLSFIIAIFAVSIFSGYLIFIVFGGTGLVTLPWYLVSSYFSKPRAVSEQE